MPSRVYEGDITIAAGTLSTAPASQVVNTPVGTIRKVTVVVPPGPSGQVGFQLQLAGTPIIPYGGGPWLIADNYRDSWDIDQDVNPGQLALVGYNTDVFPHTIYTRLEWVPPVPPAAVTTPSAAAAAAGPDTSALDTLNSSQTAAEAPVPPPDTTTPLPVCYDASGNVVDCGDPSAVSGPVTYQPPPATVTVPAAPPPIHTPPIARRPSPAPQRPKPRPRPPERQPPPVRRKQ